MNDLITIITPIYNAEKYLTQTIQSVLDQTHENWEYILVNDGSTDNSEKIVKSFTDERIKYFKQSNLGVSRARNIGLSEMNGNFFCFLDADDCFSKTSLADRLLLFNKNPKVDFVDGIVISYNSDMTIEKSSWVPSFRGRPLHELLELKDSCFFGITWMIRYQEGQDYKFDKSMSFGEDLWFYLSLSHRSRGIYDFTNTPIYLRRQVPGSAMNSMKKLVKGYHDLYKRISRSGLLASDEAKKLKGK